VQTPSGKVNYLQDENKITLRMFNRNVTLFPTKKIGVTNTPNIDLAHEFLNEILKSLINDANKDKEN